MTGQDRDNQNWTSRLKAEIKRDKKKTVILAALLIVAGIAGGRMLVSSRGPRQARAAEAGAAGPAATAETPSLLRTDQAKAGRLSDAEREAYLSGMDRRIARDLFRPRLEYFALQGGTNFETILVSVEEEPTELFGQIGRWVAQKHQAQRELQGRVTVIGAQAQALSLESTMLGASPTAIINGQVLRKGEWVSGFRVERIQSDACVVSKDGVEVELHMKR